MAIVNASVTNCPDCDFSASAQWDDAALLEIFDSVRHRKGKIDSGTKDADGQPLMRDLTNAECARFMVGSMMAGWAQNAAVDKAEAAKATAAAGIKPAGWKTLS